MNKKNNDIIVAAFVIVFSMITRLIPHLDNFSPMESAVLFGSAYFYRKIWAFILPLLCMYIVDFVINNTIARPFFTEAEGLIWFSDYMIYNAIAYVLIALAGMLILKKINILHVVSGALAASIIFYMITNFGSWADTKSIYPHDLNGLGLSYMAGIPFFRTSLVATLVFSTIFFVVFERISSILYKSDAIVR